MSRITDKLAAIKQLQQYCEDTWGYYPSLLPSKDLIENIMNNQPLNLTGEQVQRLRKVLSKADYTIGNYQSSILSEIRDILSEGKDCL